MKVKVGGESGLTRRADILVAEVHSVFDRSLVYPDTHTQVFGDDPLGECGLRSIADAAERYMKFRLYRQTSVI